VVRNNKTTTIQACPIKQVKKQVYSAKKEASGPTANLSKSAETRLAEEIPNFLTVVVVAEEVLVLKLYIRRPSVVH